MTSFAVKRLRPVVAMMLSIATGMTVAQSDIGECGADPSLNSSTTHEPLFQLDGEGRTETGLPARFQQALFDAELMLYKKKLEIIDGAVLELELERRAERSGKSRNALAAELFLVDRPDDAAVQAFYQENEARIGVPLEDVRGQIRQMLHQRAVQTKQLAVLEEAKRERGFELALVSPSAPYAEIKTDGFPSKGPLDAKITLVEFADYQCPHCQQAAGVLKKMIERYRGDLRVVFMDLPVNRSGISRSIAEGAACADRQGSFWRYHDLAFDRQSQLKHDSTVQIASELGLDMKAFRACLASEFARERVARSEGEAARLGLTSTPTLFLDGRRLHLHDLENELAEEIDKALTATKG